MALATSLVVLFIADRATADISTNFYSNTSCFSLLWLYLGNSQVSVYRTIGPTLVKFYTWKPGICRKNISCMSDVYSLR